MSHCNSNFTFQTNKYSNFFQSFCSQDISCKIFPTPVSEYIFKTLRKSRYEGKMGISEKTNQPEEDAAETERRGIAMISLNSPVKPMIMVETTEEKDADHGEEDGSNTPTSPSSKIPRVLQCPPAPRKRKPSSPIRYRNHGRDQRVSKRLFRMNFG